MITMKNYQRDAEAIMEYLLNHGVKKERIEFEFRGEKNQ